MNLGTVPHAELGRTYRITPIQQPERSAAFLGSYLSRLPLAPPLILQLDCWDADGQLIIPYDELSFLVCHLSLLTPDGEDATMMQTSAGEVVSMLYGTLVATPAEMQDQSGAAGTYLCFPDVSIRHVGRFKLKASLLRITGSPALHALKRHQLVSLSKRYGLKANGKNTELIDRLKEYASSLTPSKQFTLPLPTVTPGRAPNDFGIDSPAPSRTLQPDNQLGLSDAESSTARARAAARLSDTWSVLSDSGASMISPDKRGMTKSSSVSSWKSANNGESLTDFGVPMGEGSGITRSKSSSVKSLAVSLSRRASKHLMPRSTSASSQLSKMSESTTPARPVTPPADHEEVIADNFPPSPASTVGIPRRHSRLTLMERPSTIRLCSPTPPEFSPDVSMEVDDLPFFSPGNPRVSLKERRSMAPLSSPHKSSSAAGMTRKSMPALTSRNYSASIPSIYPPLPAAVHITPIPPVPPIPGAYQTSAPPPAIPVPSSMQFGSSAKSSTGLPLISNNQFEEAGKRLLAEMDAKLRATMGDKAGQVGSFGEELLKGKGAQVNRLVSVTEGLGEGGWGMSGSLAKKYAGGEDRYADAHQKEFARMQSIGQSKKTYGTTSVMSGATGVTTTPGGKRKVSERHKTIPSAPNGAPLTPMAPRISDTDGRDTKRKKMSPGPNALGSLREAGKSVMNLLDGQPKSGFKKSPKKRRNSVTLSRGRGLASRFGLFNKRKESIGPSTLPKAESEQQIPRSFTGSSLLQASLSTVVRSAELGEPTSSADGLERSSKPKGNSMASSVSSSNRTSIAPKEVLRHPGPSARSTSAQSVMSSNSKSTPKRSRLPDFGSSYNLQRSGSISSSAALGSLNSMGLPQASSLSSRGSANRKASQIDLIKTARPAPLPPTIEKAEPPTMATKPSAVQPVPIEMIRVTSPTLKASISTSSLPKLPISASTSMQPMAGFKRTSTLYQPTASSLARMQATVKPNPSSRPLPATPGASSTVLGASSLNVNPIAIPTTQASLLKSPSTPNMHKAFTVQSRQPLKSAMKGSLAPIRGSPAKASSSTANRSKLRASGLSAVKSKSALADEGVRARREAIRAKQERLGEEKELRMMLGWDVALGTADVDME